MNKELIIPDFFEDSGITCNPRGILLIELKYMIVKDTSMLKLVYGDWELFYNLISFDFALKIDQKVFCPNLLAERGGNGG